MRAVQCHRYAGFDDAGKLLDHPIPLRDVLSVEEIEPPTCGPDDLLIETHYAGIQYPDALQAQGLYQEKPDLPYVPGSDLTGVVSEVGANVEGFAIGDSVVAQLPFGGLSEKVVAPESRVWKVPNGVDLECCANLGRNYFASFHSLKVISDVQPGEIVLVDGASGGVGMAAIQLAKAMGAHVIAGVSTSEKKQYPKEAGADYVFEYGKTKDTYSAFKNDVRGACSELGSPDGVHCILDMVQGDLFEGALLSCIRPLGKVCLIGFTAGQKPIRPGMILIKQASVVGSLWGPWARENPDAHQANVQEILGFFANGKVKPRVDRVIDFDNFIEAFELFESNRGRGNTVIKVKA